MSRYLQTGGRKNSCYIQSRTISGYVINGLHCITIIQNTAGSWYYQFAKFSKNSPSWPIAFFQWLQGLSLASNCQTWLADYQKHMTKLMRANKKERFPVKFWLVESSTPGENFKYSKRLKAAQTFHYFALLEYSTCLFFNTSVHGAQSPLDDFPFPLPCCLK